MLGLGGPDPPSHTQKSSRTTLQHESCDVLRPFPPQNLGKNVRNVTRLEEDRGASEPRRLAGIHRCGHFVRAHQ